MKLGVVAFLYTCVLESTFIQHGCDNFHKISKNCFTFSSRIHFWTPTKETHRTPRAPAPAKEAPPIRTFCAPSRESNPKPNKKKKRFLTIELEV